MIYLFNSQKNAFGLYSSFGQGVKPISLPKRALLPRGAAFWGIGRSQTVQSLWNAVKRPHESSNQVSKQVCKDVLKASKNVNIFSLLLGIELVISNQ